MCLRDLRAVLVRSGDPRRLIHPRSMAACRAGSGGRDRTPPGWAGEVAGARERQEEARSCLTALGRLCFVSLSGVRTQPGHPSGMETA